jgi:Low affinity iron permease
MRRGAIGHCATSSIDELIRVTNQARNRLINLEDLTGEEVDKVKQELTSIPRADRDNPDTHLDGDRRKPKQAAIVGKRAHARPSFDRTKERFTLMLAQPDSDAKRVVVGIR